MGTSKTFLQNATTRHAIFVQRFAGSQMKEILPLLQKAKADTIAKLSKKNLSELGKRELNATLKDIDYNLNIIYTKMGKKLTKNMEEFGKYEAEFSARMFTKAAEADFKKPSNTAVVSAIISRPLVLTDEALSLESTLRTFSKAKRGEMITLIKNGVVKGQTNEEIIKELSFVTDKIQKNHAAALVKTVTNHVSSIARQLIMEENDDIIEAYQWVSTLDGRTTYTCQSLDGKIFEKGKGNPMPPLHWGCRSTTVPVVKKEYKLVSDDAFERTAKGDTGKTEMVKASSTYNSWLKTQSVEFQAEVLGEKRAKLFREGGLNVNQFVDKNYSSLTLEQLKRKEPLAFKKAGLTDE